MRCALSSEVQKILPVVYAEVFGKLHHLVVPDGIDPGQVSGEHINLGGLLHGFNEAEGFVQRLSGTVNAVHSPDHQPELLHLFRRGLSDGVGAAEHPGQHPHAVGEHHDALGTHLPQGMGQLLFVQLVDIVHGQGIGGMAMHHHPVCRVNGEPRPVAHHVGGKLGGEFASVLVAPQQLGSLAILGNADDAQIGFGITLDVLEILAGTGDDKDLTDDGSGIKAQRNGADDMVQVEVLSYFIGIQQAADVAAVALIPAKTVHICSGFPHLLHKGSSQNILHSKPLWNAGQFPARLDFITSACGSGP